MFYIRKQISADLKPFDAYINIASGKTGMKDYLLPLNYDYWGTIETRFNFLSSEPISNGTSISSWCKVLLLMKLFLARVWVYLFPLANCIWLQLKELSCIAIVNVIFLLSTPFINLIAVSTKLNFKKLSITLIWQ